MAIPARSWGAASRAEVTVTFFRGKPGHYSLEGLRRCGELHVVDIGIPAAVLDAIRPELWRNAPPLWSAALRRDDAGDNKYTRGHLTILGGDLATGAARLAALARAAGRGRPRHHRFDRGGGWHLSRSGARQSDSTPAPSTGLIED